MKSKLINMVERTKSEEDRALEALFASEPVADNGFSAAVVKRLEKRLWLRRVALPTAIALGLAIAVKPLLGLFYSLAGAAAAVPGAIEGFNFAPALPQVSTSVVMAGLALAAMLLIPALDD